MNDRNPPNPGGLPATILLVGKALGFGIALLLSPLVYSLTRGWIYLYFAEAVGAGGFAALLTGVLIVLEIVVIFGLVTVAMSFAMSWVLTILVMRGMR